MNVPNPGPTVADGMPDGLKSVFEILWWHTARLHVKFGEHQALFGSKQRYDFLQSIAPVFFSTAVEDPLWDSILLGIMQLTAPTSTMGRKNMTVRALPALVETTIQDQVAVATNDAVAAADFAVAARNQWIAHLDHATALDPEGSGVTLGSRDQVRASLASIENVLNVVSRHYNVRTSALDLGWTPDADRLVALLEFGAAARANSRGAAST